MMKEKEQTRKKKLTKLLPAVFPSFYTPGVRPDVFRLYVCDGERASDPSMMSDLYKSLMLSIRGNGRACEFANTASEIITRGRCSYF